MIRKGIGWLWLRLHGWRVVGSFEARKLVLIAAPHTTNWDLAFMLATTYVLGVRVHWIGKHTLFKPPLGWLLRRVGGVPVDRRAPQGMVGQVVQRFQEADDLILAVPPEGTRSKAAGWKSGFYYIALGAKVPIGLGFLDYKRKEAGIGGVIQPTGDVRADMERIRAFYKDIHGKYPAHESEIRLKEEDVEDGRTAAQADKSAGVTTVPDVMN